jgi:hypothetical protein
MLRIIENYCSSIHKVTEVAKASKKGEVRTQGNIDSTHALTKTCNTANAMVLFDRAYKKLGQGTNKLHCNTAANSSSKYPV